MQQMPSYSAGLHRAALLTAVATFPLIFMGGLVTSHGAGMSVPDWPNSFGYNMFLLPPSLWLGEQAGGVFYEHSHRLMGSVVGMLSIALAIWAWVVERRRWVRWLAIGVLGAVILQGVLGGLRVLMVELDLAVVHGCFAQAFFCLTALMALVTSRWWHQGAGTEGGRPPVAAYRPILALAVVAVGAIYLQLVVGALMRHYGAGLAIPDLPLAYGKLLPPTTDAELAKARWDHAMVYRVPSAGAPLTFGQVWLHFGHRVGAVVVTAAVGVLVARVLRRHRRERALVVPAVVLCGLLLTQVTLGVFTVLYRKPADVASAHVAVGALVLLTAFVIAARAWRLNWLAKRPAAEARAFPPGPPRRRAMVTDQADPTPELLPA